METYPFDSAAVAAILAWVAIADLLGKRADGDHHRAEEALVSPPEGGFQAALPGSASCQMLLVVDLLLPVVENRGSMPL